MARLERVILVTGMLLAFLVGTNYCLLAALTGPAHGAVMACHADPGAPRSGSHGCCRPGGAAKSDPPEPTSTMPCCMAAAATSVPELAKPQAAGPLTPFGVLVVVSRVAPINARWHGPPQDLRDRTPASFARAPLGSRAPPLV